MKTPRRRRAEWARRLDALTMALMDAGIIFKNASIRGIGSCVQLEIDNGTSWRVSVKWSFKNGCHSIDSLQDGDGLFMDGEWHTFVAGPSSTSFSKAIVRELARLLLGPRPPHLRGESRGSSVIDCVEFSRAGTIDLPPVATKQER
jgi:hypothetical protein